MTYRIEQARFRATLFDNPALSGPLFVRAVALALSLGFSTLVFLAGWASIGTGKARNPAITGKGQALAIALGDATKAEDAIATRGADTASFDNNLPGGAGRMDAAANSFAEDVRDAYAAYHATLATMNYYQLLVPLRVDNDPGFVRTHGTLERMRAAVETREKKLDEAVSAFRTQVASADIDARAKQSALQRLDRVIATSSQKRVRETALEESLIDEQETMLADLAAAPESWNATGPTVLVFHDEVAMNTYHAHVASLVRIAAALNAMIGRARA
jgi:hypothetical protein